MFLTLEAASHPNVFADFHTNPPIEVFKHFAGVRNTETTGGINVAYVHNPQSSQKGHMNADGVVERGSVWTAKRFITRRSEGKRFADEQERIVISLEISNLLRQGRLCLRFRSA